MSLLIKKPNKFLAKHIHRFTSLSIENQTVKLFPTGSFRKPDSKIRLAFHFTEDVPWVKIGDQKITQAQQNIRGFQFNPITFNASHSVDVLTVEFTPYGFYNIFGISCSDLTIAPLSLDSVLQGDYQMLLGELYSKSSFAQRVAFLEHYLLKKVNPDWALDKAHCIYQTLSQADSLLNAKELAQNTFLTERTQRRFFLKHFGLSPKSFINFYRFQKSLSAVSEIKNNPLLDTAIKYGYYDQAHFGNEFKTYMGMSPLEFREQLKAAPIIEFPEELPR